MALPLEGALSPNNSSMVRPLCAMLMGSRPAEDKGAGPLLFWGETVEMRTGIGRCVVSCVALSVCLLIISGCAALGDRPKADLKDTAERHLNLGRLLLGQHEYEGALKECDAALRKWNGKPGGDEALLCIAQVYSDPLNRARDFSKSIASLERIVNEYPLSPRADLARIFEDSLREQEKLKRAVAESGQETEKLKRQLADTAQESERLKRRVTEVSQETARLKRIVEESKTVDAEMDEKKRSHTK